MGSWSIKYCREAPSINHFAALQSPSCITPPLVRCKTSSRDTEPIHQNIAGGRALWSCHGTPGLDSRFWNKARPRGDRGWHWHWCITISAPPVTSQHCATLMTTYWPRTPRGPWHCHVIGDYCWWNASASVPACELRACGTWAKIRRIFAKPVPHSDTC